MDDPEGPRQRRRDICCSRSTRPRPRSSANDATTRLANANIPSDGLRATTFHAFGLRVIGEATGEKPRLAPGLDNEQRSSVCSADVVRALRRRSPEFAARWSLFQNVLGVPVSAEARNLSPTRGIRRSVEADSARSTSTVMKSAGERAIANWLIKAGVEFEYERPYEVNVADAQHSQYRPDFFYPSIGVYHEHWALVPGQAEPPGLRGVSRVQCLEEESLTPPTARR